MSPKMPDTSNVRALRRPSQAYKNKNGFASSEYYHDPSNVESAKTPKQLRDEVEAHFSAEQVLEVRGCHFRSVCCVSAVAKMR